MSDKIARLGIERNNDMMYYIKNGDVWATPRKQKGQPKGKAQKVAAAGLELDYSKYLYFLDGDGDVARKARTLGGGGGRRSKAKAKAKEKTNGNGTKTTRTTPRSSISGHYVTEATAKRRPKTTVTETVKVATGRKKSPAQLEREIEECLAQKKGGNGNGGNGPKNGNGTNGTKSAAKPAVKKKKRRR